jgi:hypothetical protein
MAAEERLPSPARATGDPRVRLTRVRSAAMWGVAVTWVVCSMEAAPGRGLLQPGWDRWAFYLVAGAVGALGGAALARHWLAGLVAGGPAMAGAVFGASLISEHLTGVVPESLGRNATFVWVDTFVTVLAGGLGALPGWAVYLGWARAYDRLAGPAGITQGPERGG